MMCIQATERNNQIMNMKHASNRRSRSRGNNNNSGGGKRYPNQKGGVFESNGPEVKIRGNPHQVHEKYLGLARDAASAGDRITAESYFQYAEHYYRIMNAEQANNPNRNNSGNAGGNNDGGGRGGRNNQQQQANVDPAQSEQPDIKPPRAGGERAVETNESPVQVPIPAPAPAETIVPVTISDEPLAVNSEAVVVEIAAAEKPKAPRKKRSVAAPEATDPETAAS